MVDVLDEANAVLLDLDPEPVLTERVDREAHAERAVVTDRLADQLEDLTQEARAVLEASRRTRRCAG